MAWQKGPGEGYHAAKDDALAINPKLKCQKVMRATHAGGPARFFGFQVVDQRGKIVGLAGTLSRDAWGDAFFRLGGKYVKGRVVLPKRRKR